MAMPRDGSATPAENVYIPVALLALALVLLIGGAPTAFVWFDQLHHWALAREWIEGGTRLPLRGATVSGVGQNGPLYHLFLGFGLLLTEGEVGMAVFTTVAAAMGVTAAAWAAWRRWGVGVLWVFAVVVSHPVLSEWIRVGEDFSYLPALLPLLLLGWVKVERAPTDAVGWGLWGVLCGAALQLHVTTGPALLLASIWLWQPRRAPWAPVLTLLGAAMTYVTVWLDPQLTGVRMTWANLPQTAAVLVEAMWQATKVRAENFWFPPLAAAWPTLALFGAAAASLVVGGKGARRFFVMAVASLAFVSFDESAHYHHLMHLDIVLVSVLAAGALTLATSRMGRALLLAGIAWQLGVSGSNVVAANSDGIVIQYASYPLRWPGVREEAATAALRDALRHELGSAGLHTRAERMLAIRGDTLVFLEHAWTFLEDALVEPPITAFPRGAVFELRRRRCGVSEGRSLPGHCLIRIPQDDAPPDDTEGAVRLDSQTNLWQPLNAWPLRAAHAVGAGVFPRHMAPLVVQPAAAFPVRIAPDATGRRMTALTLRQYRIPQTTSLDVQIAGPESSTRLLPHDERHGHLLRERHWVFAGAVTSVEMFVAGPAGVVAFDLEIELDRP
jgi:hypothetical protein